MTETGRTRPSIVFLCVHNAGRSQMAAGWAAHLAGETALISSGGSDPAVAVNAAAIEAMAEVGIDIGEAAPQRWTDKAIRGADVVVTMGCGDSCPVYPGIRYVDWDLEDPSGQPIERIRSIRDAIGALVESLLSELGIDQR